MLHLLCYWSCGMTGKVRADINARLSIPEIRCKHEGPLPIRFCRYHSHHPMPAMQRLRALSGTVRAPPTLAGRALVLDVGNIGAVPETGAPPLH